MKKRYIVIGLLMSALTAAAQKPDSTYHKRKISKTDVQVMMSFYTQDNDHSAVTGGIGTEALQVYAAQFSVDHQIDSLNAYHFDTGVDIISSASTDNIDFVKSSASKVDARTHVNAGLQHTFKHRGITAGVNSGLSIESDYSSLAAGFNLSKLNTSASRQFSASFQSYFDDLRWGRLHSGTPQKLIYPSELKNTEWFSNYRRYSYNFELGFFQVINTRTTLGIYPGIAYQTGLLSTPFHRIYFADKSEKVEYLPNRRLKLPVGIQFNKFLGGRWILRTNYRFYWDDFGVIANAFNVEAVLKIAPTLSVTGMFRMYHQSASKYFGGYEAHDTNDPYYTSDYDLSDFSSYKPGISFRYAPYRKGALTSLSSIELHYAFYKRSDGLSAHMATLLINMTVEGQRKIKR